MGWTRRAARLWVYRSGRDPARRRCDDRRPAKTFCTVGLSPIEGPASWRTSGSGPGRRRLRRAPIHPASTPQGEDAPAPWAEPPTHGKYHIIYFLRLQLQAPPPDSGSSQLDTHLCKCWNICWNVDHGSSNKSDCRLPKMAPSSPDSRDFESV